MASRSERKRSGQQAESSDPKAKNWWQWFLIYPALGIALITAVPDWIDKGLAAYNGLKSSSYAEAMKQSSMWRKNLSCSTTPFNWYQNPTQIKLDALICDSGDVFVRALTPDNKHHFRWIALDDVVMADGSGGFAIVPEAKASSLSSELRLAVAPRHSQAAKLYPAMLQEGIVICTKFLDQRMLLRHLKTPQGCFDEVVDTFNGVAVKRTQVPCRSGC